MTAEHTAVTMGRILAHAHITDHIQIREQFFCFAETLLHNAILCIRTASQLILVIRDSKKHDTADPCFTQLLQFFLHTIHTVTVLSHHGWDLFLNICSFYNKHRIDQRRFIHSGLPNHFS